MISTEIMIILMVAMLINIMMIIIIIIALMMIQDWHLIDRNTPADVSVLPWIAVLRESLMIKN